MSSGESLQQPAPHPRILALLSSFPGCPFDSLREGNCLPLPAYYVPVDRGINLRNTLSGVTSVRATSPLLLAYTTNLSLTSYCSIVLPRAPRSNRDSFTFTLVVEYTMKASCPLTLTHQPRWLGCSAVFPSQ